MLETCLHAVVPLFLPLQVMVEAYRRDAGSKDQLISELKSTKKRLIAEMKELKQELQGAQGERQQAELEQARLQKEVLRVQEQMSSMEAHLQAIQAERDQLETQMQVSTDVLRCDRGFQSERPVTPRVFGSSLCSSTRASSQR